MERKWKILPGRNAFVNFLSAPLVPWMFLTIQLFMVFSANTHWTFTILVSRNDVLCSFPRLLSTLLGWLSLLGADPVDHVCELLCSLLLAGFSEGLPQADCRLTHRHTGGLFHMTFFFSVLITFLPSAFETWRQESLLLALGVLSYPVLFLCLWLWAF